MKIKSQDNYFLYVLVLSTVLFLVGASLLLSLSLWSSKKQNHSDQTLVIELQTSSNKEQIQNLQDQLKSIVEIDASSISWISKEVALEKMQTEISQVILDKQENPFTDILVCTLKSNSSSVSVIEKIKQNELYKTVIQDIQLLNADQNNSHLFLTKLISGSIVFLIVFLCICLFIFWYLSGLFVGERMEVISSLVLMGASQHTLLSAYNKRSIIFGLAAALLAIGGLGLVLITIYSFFPWMKEIIGLQNFFLSFFVLILLGPMVHYFFVKKRIQSIIKN